MGDINPPVRLLIASDLFPSWRLTTVTNWPVTSCTTRCIPSSMHTSRPSRSPKALRGRKVAVVSPDHQRRERRKTKQTSATGCHLQTEHVPRWNIPFDWAGWGRELHLTRLFKKIRHVQVPAYFTREPTMHAKDNWAMTHFRVSICSLSNGSIFMYLSKVTKTIFVIQNPDPNKVKLEVFTLLPTLKCWKH